MEVGRHNLAVPDLNSSLSVLIRSLFSTLHNFCRSSLYTGARPASASPKHNANLRNKEKVIILNTNCAFHIAKDLKLKNSDGETVLTCTATV